MDTTRAIRLVALAAALVAAAGAAPGQELRLDLPPARPGPVAFERAFPKVPFRQPVFLEVPPDGSGRVFLVGQLGDIRVLPDDDDATSAALFLDLSRKVEPGIERGLLGLAFDPDYKTNGRFYVHYSVVRSGKAVVSCFRVRPDNPDEADPESEEVLLELADRDGNHNGGMLAFGPDRMLYASLGDDMDRRNAQNRMTPHGSILRIDVSSAESYAIPPDNPFVGVGAARGEIWAYGFRNPWRFSFDRLTGDMWVGDVGEGREEIDLVRKGGNYGWGRWDGRFPVESAERYPASDYEAPILDYPRSCVIGGYVYRGREIPGLSGAYIYGDHLTGDVLALRYDGLRVTSNERIGRVERLTSFGERPDGELFALGLDGRIWRMKRGGSGGGEPARKLSSTGLFTSTEGLVPAPGLVEYDVNAELWSDGARKRRWLALPEGGRIRFSRDGAFEFPVGTAVVKHFELPLAASGSRRIETRVLVLREDGWSGFTFKWNAKGDDADLLVDAEDERLDLGDGRSQVWRFPGRSQCIQCHTPAAGYVLGLRADQLNRDLGGENQLRAWAGKGLFDGNVDDPAALPALPDPRDGSAPLASRARAYLAANCAQCHRAGSTTPGGIDFRYEVGAADMNIVGVPASAGDLGLPGGMRVKPGAKEASVLWERLRRHGVARMPPLGSDVVDPLAVEVVGEWIDTLR